MKITNQPSLSISVHRLQNSGDFFLIPRVKEKDGNHSWHSESLPHLPPAPYKVSETPPSGFQAPLPLCTIVPAQVQTAKIYAKPTKKEIKDVEGTYIYYNSKPTEVYVV